MSVRTLALAAVALVSLVLSSAPAVAHPLAGTGCAHANASVTTLTAGQARLAILCLVNAERADRGVRSLRAEAHLREAAIAYARDMVARRFFDHISPEGAAFDERIADAGYEGSSTAETLAWAQAPADAPADLVDTWMDSRPHRAILLDPEYARVGVGLAAGLPLAADDGGPVDGVTAVLDFGDR